MSFRPLRRSDLIRVAIVVISSVLALSLAGLRANSFLLKPNIFSIGIVNSEGENYNFWQAILIKSSGTNGLRWPALTLYYQYSYLPRTSEPPLTFVILNFQNIELNNISPFETIVAGNQDPKDFELKAEAFDRWYDVAWANNVWLAVWVNRGSSTSKYGYDMDIMSAYSFDHGLTWSAPLAVNSDAQTDNFDDKNPTITSYNGYFMVFWEKAGPDFSQSVMSSYSTDLGKSWKNIMTVSLFGLPTVVANRGNVVGTTSNGYTIFTALLSARNTSYGNNSILFSTALNLFSNLNSWGIPLPILSVSSLDGLDASNPYAACETDILPNICAITFMKGTPRLFEAYIQTIGSDSLGVSVTRNITDTIQGTTNWANREIALIKNGTNSYFLTVVEERFLTQFTITKTFDSLDWTTITTSTAGYFSPSLACSQSGSGICVIVPTTLIGRSYVPISIISYNGGNDWQTPNYLRAIDQNNSTFPSVKSDYVGNFMYIYRLQDSGGNFTLRVGFLGRADCFPTNDRRYNVCDKRCPLILNAVNVTCIDGKLVVPDVSLSNQTDLSSTIINITNLIVSNASLSISNSTVNIGSINISNSQTVNINSSAVILQDVRVDSGSISISSPSTNPVIQGSLSLATGSTLDLGLEGKILTVSGCVNLTGILNLTISPQNVKNQGEFNVMNLGNTACSTASFEKVNVFLDDPAGCLSASNSNAQIKSSFLIVFFELIDTCPIPEADLAGLILPWSLLVLFPLSLVAVI